MGVDYIENLDCRVKRELGLETLVMLLKSRAHIYALQAHLEAQGTDPATATIKRVVQYPAGPKTEEVGMADLLEAATVLEPYEPLCDGCTANFRLKPFGCCGYLNYPITAAEEIWLVSRLPSSADSVAGIYLRNAIRELEVDGEMVANMRGHGRLYLERPRAMAHHWTGMGDPAPVTSDQMLQLLFYSGGISPMHGAFICLFLGLIPHDISADAMQAILKSPDQMQDHLVIDPPTLKILGETQIGMFLMGLMSSAINLETLLLDA